MSGVSPTEGPLSTARVCSVARRLAALPRPRTGTPVADAELLGRFVDHRDEEAFAELAARHLPAVRAVCRSVLRNTADADDAVQATFLVLVRRAAAVRDRRALGGWLCRVAWRTANRLRTDIMRRSARASVVEPDTTPARGIGGPSEVCAALHEEIARLPEAYRVAVLTCYAAGTPTAEAAARLGWPKGTLLTRLAWARKRLRDRLTKRGVTLAGGFGAAFGGRVEVAGSAVLAGRLAEVAVMLAAGDPAARGLVTDRVSLLTEGMIRHMVASKLKLTAAGLVAVAVLGLGLGRMTAGADQGDKKGNTAVGGLIGSGTSPGVGAGIGTAKPAVAPLVVAEAEPDGAGEEVIRVRRPRGSYTKEVPPFGKGTVTFTDKRLHVAGSVHIDQATINFTLDADYSINQDGVVYGVFTGAEVTATGAKGEEAATLGIYAGMVTDMPFAFRLRVDDDAINIRDIKFGPFGSPLMMEAFKNDSGKEMMMIGGMIGGKFKADPHPDHRPLPAVPAGPRPKKVGTSRS